MNFKKILKLDSGDSHQMMIKFFITSAIGIFLSISLFIVSGIATKASSHYFSKGVQAIRFDLIHLNNSVSYSGVTLDYALRSYYTFTEESIDQDLLKRVGMMVDFDAYRILTANSTEKGNQIMFFLKARRNSWENFEKLLFVVLIISQIYNTWLAFKLQYLDHTKKVQNC